MFFRSDLDNVKFGSGLTWDEAEILVDRLVEGYEGCSMEGKIELLKNHIKRAVRNHKDEREMISALAAK